MSPQTSPQSPGPSSKVAHITFEHPRTLVSSHALEPPSRGQAASLSTCFMARPKSHACTFVCYNPIPTLNESNLCKLTAGSGMLCLFSLYPWPLLRPRLCLYLSPRLLCLLAFSSFPMPQLFSALTLTRLLVVHYNPASSPNSPRYTWLSGMEACWYDCLLSCFSA